MRSLLIGILALGFTLAQASPRKITNDTALYQELTELDIKKVRKADLESSFDQDVKRLALLEQNNRYREELPAVKRIQKRKY